VPTVKFKSSDPVNKPGEANQDAEFANFKVFPEKVIEVAMKPEPAITPEAVPDAIKTTVVKRYQIVVGAFSKATNAERYVAELQGKNYSASIVGKSASGLIRVSISGFDAKGDALGMLREVRANENPSAWLLVIR